jgi:hypothetical protein
VVGKSIAAEMSQKKSAPTGVSALLKSGAFTKNILADGPVSRILYGG